MGARTSHEARSRVAVNSLPRDEHGGVTGRPTDGPAKEHRLGAEMPLRVIEEDAVMDGDRAGHPGPFGHGVVRCVMQLDAERSDEAGQPDLLEDESDRA